MRTDSRFRPKAMAAVMVMFAVLLTLLTACSSGHKSKTNDGKGKADASAVKVGTVRTPPFGPAGGLAPTTKVLPSAEPTLIVQFPLAPASLKARFPDATGIVTVTQGDPEHSVYDTVTITVDKMPPNTKFTAFLVESSATPFGRAEYVGDVFTRGDGTGESIFHVIALAAFAADNRTPVTSKDQSGDASGVQLEHFGLWFDSIDTARQVLGAAGTQATPFDGGPPPVHGGPQAMTDGQSLPVL